MSDSVSGQRSNRRSVCPLSTKVKRMKSLDKQSSEDLQSDLRSGEQVYAVKGFSDHKNNQSLSFIEGDVITLLDQFTDGMCKGYISKLGPESKIGIFPATCVVPFMKNKFIFNIQKKMITSISNSKPTNKAVGSSLSSTNMERSGHKISPIQHVSDSSHIYSCDYNEICMKYVNLESPAKHSGDIANRASSISVDSGRGSTNVPVKMAGIINSSQIPNPTLHMAESCNSPSIESGLASYQHQGSSSSSSIGGASSIDDSNNSLVKKSSLFLMDIEQRDSSISSNEEDKNDEMNIKNWLQHLSLEFYAKNFIEAGYDFSTLMKMTPEDLNAIGITNPNHRKIIKSDISNLSGSVLDNLPECIPETVEEWLKFLNFNTYVDMVLNQGYDTVDKLTDITWEDLEEIGIRKLGHQKKIILAVEKLKKVKKIWQSDKISYSYSLENVKDIRPKLCSIDCIQSNQENYKNNQSYFESPLKIFNLQKPIPPIRQWSNLANRFSFNNVFSSSLQENNTSISESVIPPPTPKRISSINSISSPIKCASREAKGRRPYENVNETIELYHQMSNSDKVSIHDSSLNASSLTMSTNLSVVKSSSPKAIRSRSSSIMFMELNSLPFANENCGTIKQRSSSLGRNEMLREEIETGISNIQNFILPILKPVLPLSLPYNIESLSYKPLSCSEKLKMNLSAEQTAKVIPTDVHVAATEKVPMPKLHLEDSSSNEDFNEICDMLEDLTELLDKEVTRDNK